jgi:predicted Zn-dependent protease
VHWGINAEQDEADKREAIAHYALASRVMERLYTALKADERVWGTTQLFAVPAILLNKDGSINAAANWKSNSIQVNKGLFRLIDEVGEKGEDVLAATLAHEMSHIFYRHPGYGSSGQGLKGIFDELRGVTALDRVQETEADILGIRVACQAGYDPQGMLILMRVFAQLDGSARVLA